MLSVACMSSTGAHAVIIGVMEEGAIYEWQIESNRTAAGGTFTCDAACATTQTVDYERTPPHQSAYITLDGVTYRPDPEQTEVQFERVAFSLQTRNLASGLISTIRYDTLDNALRIWTEQPVQIPVWQTDGSKIRVDFQGEFYVEQVQQARGITLVATAPVPLPAAVWLFGSGLIGLVGMGRRKNNS